MSLCTKKGILLNCVNNWIFWKPIMNSMFQANDALHLSMLDGCDISIDHLGDVILQDTFHVWDPKKLIRQSRERRMFLFELYMVFSKEVKDSNGKAKYQYKMKMMVRQIHIFVLQLFFIITFSRPVTWASLNTWRVTSVNLLSGPEGLTPLSPK